MARIKNGQMSLYEAVDQARFKAAQGREIERVAGEEPKPRQVFGEKLSIPAPKVASVPVQETPPVKVVPQVQPQPSPPSQPKTNVWAQKPAMFQLNNGRVELFLPFQIAGLVVLVVCLALLVFYWIGRHAGKNATLKAMQAPVVSSVIAENTEEVAKKMAEISVRQVQKPVIKAEIPPAEAVTTTTTGPYVIVLKELASARNLEPAKEFFDKNGIPTEIRQSGGSYFLITKQRFENVRKGGEGYTVLEKIRKVGRGYKTPAGYGNFGTKMFDDAYGRKLN